MLSLVEAGGLSFRQRVFLIERWQPVRSRPLRAEEVLCSSTRFLMMRGCEAVDADGDRSKRCERTSKGAKRRGRQGVGSLDDVHYLRTLSCDRLRIGNAPRPLSRNPDQVAVARGRPAP